MGVFVSENCVGYFVSVYFDFLTYLVFIHGDRDNSPP